MGRKLGLVLPWTQLRKAVMIRAWSAGVAKSSTGGGRHGRKVNCPSTSRPVTKSAGRFIPSLLRFFEPPPLRDPSCAVLSRGGPPSFHQECLGGTAAPTPGRRPRCPCVDAGDVGIYAVLH